MGRKKSNHRLAIMIPVTRGAPLGYDSMLFFFIAGCPGQFARITIISHGLLNILQAQ